MRKKRQFSFPDFDNVVVGAGSAGSVLANRLTKNSKVLLLEAGGAPLPIVNSVPGFTTELLHLKELDWLHQTTSQKNALLLSENQVIMYQSLIWGIHSHSLIIIIIQLIYVIGCKMAERKDARRNEQFKLYVVHERTSTGFWQLGESDRRSQLEVWKCPVQLRKVPDTQRKSYKNW